MLRAQNEKREMEKKKHQWQFCGISKCKMTDWNIHRTSRKLERVWNVYETKNMKCSDGENVLLYMVYGTWFACWFTRVVAAANKFMLMKCGGKSASALLMHAIRHTHISIRSAIQQNFKISTSYGHFAPHILHSTIYSKSEMLCCAQARIPCLYAILHRNTLVTLNQFYAVLLQWMLLVVCMHCRRYSTQTLIIHIIIFRSFTFGFIL